MIFIPKKYYGYWYIGVNGEIYYSSNTECPIDSYNIKSGNCYRTQEDAIRARNRSYAKRELEVLADELNGGVEIDWKNQEQPKYAIMCDVEVNHFIQTTSPTLKNIIDIECLSKNFLEEALKRLGEEKLKLILDIKEYR